MLPKKLLKGIEEIFQCDGNLKWFVESIALFHTPFKYLKYFQTTIFSFWQFGAINGQYCKIYRKGGLKKI